MDNLPLSTDDSPSLPQQAGRAEREALIQAALNALPPDYRLVVVLQYFEGLSGTEMADATGRSVKAV